MAAVKSLVVDQFFIHCHTGDTQSDNLRCFKILNDIYNYLIGQNWHGTLWSLDGAT